MTSSVQINPRTQRIDQVLVQLRAKPVTTPKPVAPPLAQAPRSAVDNQAAAQVAVRRAATELKRAQRVAEAMAVASRPWQMPCVRCDQVRYIDARTDLCGPCFDGAGTGGAWSM